MEAICASPKQFFEVKKIVQTTVEATYPLYYPLSTISLILDEYSDQVIKDALENKETYLFYDQEKLIGTGSIFANEIKRVFVLPMHQGLGFGSEIMDYFEDLAFQNYDSIVVDAVLPVCSLCLKRGYVLMDYQKMKTSMGDYFCYIIMQKLREKKY